MRLTHGPRGQTTLQVAGVGPLDLLGSERSQLDPAEEGLEASNLELVVLQGCRPHRLPHRVLEPAG